MIAFFLHIYDWMSQHRRIAIALFVVMTLGLVVSLLQMHYSEDISDFLPQNEQSRKYTDIYNQLGGQNKIFVIFEGEEDSVLNAMDAFGEKWQETEQTFDETNDQSLASTNEKSIDKQSDRVELQVEYDEEQMLNLLSFIEENIPYFLQEQDYQRMDSLLRQPDYIHQQLELDKQMLMLPTSGTMTLHLQADPLHLFSSVQQRLRNLKVSDQFQLIDSHLFTRDGRRGIVTMRSPFGVSESKNNKRLQSLIDSTAAAVGKDYPTVNISSVGGPLIAVSNAEQIKHDSILAVSISILLILGVLLYVFRRLRDLLWIAISLLFGGIFALGIIALYKDTISIIVLGIGSVIIGIAANYPLHLLDHLRHETNPRAALREMVSPLLIGNITTVGAFLCLVPLEADAMCDLGAFGALTLVGTIIFVLIFLPIFVTPRRQPSAVGNIQFHLPSFCPKKKMLLIPFLLITVVLGYYSLDTSFDANMQHINYMTESQRSDLKMLTESVTSKQGESQLFAVAEGKDMESALQANEQMLLGIDSLPLRISSISHFVPSMRRQKECIQRWHKFWQCHADVLPRLQQEAQLAGFSSDAFAPFVEITQADYQPQPFAYFAPVTQVMGEGFITHVGGQVALVNYLKGNEQQTQQAERIIDNAAKTQGKQVDDCQYAFSTSEVAGQLVTLLSNDFNYIGFVCGFIVFFFLWFSFGSLELSLLSFLPLGIGWIWILGTMQVFGIQFNIVNIILATFIFGQGDDYTIFITEGMMYEYAYGKKILRAYKNSVILSAIIMFVGIGTLILAKHPAMHSLAEVTLVGMFTVVLMAFYLPPLVFNWMTRRHGELRKVPLTCKRILASLIAMGWFLLCIFAFGPIMKIYFKIGPATERKRLFLHRLFQWFSYMSMNYVPFAPFRLNNPHGETFQKPGIIISNHQSMLDLMAVMHLTPKLVIVTKDWVWNNIFFGDLVRLAEFYPAHDGLAEGIDRFQSLIDRGYSIMIFPEGTRSPDCKIHRFHKGAFYLAQQLHVDIIPLFLHGYGHILAKDDFMLREGKFYMEIGERIHPDDTTWGETDRERTSSIHRMYVEHYAEICRQCEDVAYWSHFIPYKYMYKSKEILQRCRRTLRQCQQHDDFFRQPIQRGQLVALTHVGQGEAAWLMALMHRDVEFYATDSDADDLTLAAHCSHLPENLHFVSEGAMPTCHLIINVQSVLSEEV